MRKKLFFIIIFLIFVGENFCQDITASVIINRCISLLGKTVPNGFTRGNRTMYFNDEGIVLIVENGISTTVVVQSAFETFNKAHEVNGMFYDYFENTMYKWRYYRGLTDGSDMYVRDGVYAHIIKPSKRDDGLIFTGVQFTRND